jgi:hypothetical protein
MARVRGARPHRDRDVYFIGAGVSASLDMPNTAGLLEALKRFFDTPSGTHWAIQSSIEEAVEFFYPDALGNGGTYQPDAVDFFSTLKTFVDVGAGWTGTGLPDSPELFRSLKRAIAHLMCWKIRDVGDATIKNHGYLQQIVQPGNIIITTNWDTIVETHAALNNVPLRRSSIGNVFHTEEVVLLKLHGSVDWCQGSARKPAFADTAHDTDFANLSERERGVGVSRVPLPQIAQALETRDDVIRIVPEKPGRLWQTVTSRAREPWIATMATGKADALGPLTSIWRDAYNAIGYARHFEVTGYSLPSDDVEVRTLMRSGLKKGNELKKITVRNPSPDVHQRFRSLVVPNLETIYRGV